MNCDWCLGGKGGRKDLFQPAKTKDRCIRLFPSVLELVGFMSTVKVLASLLGFLGLNVSYLKLAAKKKSKLGKLACHPIRSKLNRRLSPLADIELDLKLQIKLYANYMQIFKRTTE